MKQRTFDTVLVPLGNGALITGMARWIKHVAPDVRVVGVSSVTADEMEASWRSGTVIERASANTIAVGIAVRTPSTARGSLSNLLELPALRQCSNINTCAPSAWQQFCAAAISPRSK